jgi:hypothetical protein
MTTDYRALCAELHAAIQLYTGQNPAAADIPSNQLVRQLMDAMAATADALAQPEPEGPTDEEAVALYSEVMAFHDCQTLGDMAGNFARAVLTRWGRSIPQPFLVSERMPEHGDLDAEGTCWMWHPIYYHYCRCRPDPSVHTCWLPHWALPLPTDQ